MMKKISKLIVLALLLIYGAIQLITNFSTTPLWLACGILAVLALLLLTNDRPISTQINWIVTAMFLMMFLLPLSQLDETQLELALTRMELMWELFWCNDVAKIALPVFLALQLFFRSKPNAIAVIARYTAAYIALRTLSATIFLDGTYSELIAVAVMCSMNTELIASKNGRSRPAMLVCVVPVVIALALHFLLGSAASSTIHAFFRMDSATWIYTTILVAMAAALILVDVYLHVENDPAHIFTEYGLGWSLLFWCLLSVIMNVWPATKDVSVLIFWFPLAYQCCYTFVKVRDTHCSRSWGEWFAICWSVTTGVLLLIGKSLHLPVLFSEALLIVLVAGSLLWYLAHKGKISRSLVGNFLGVAAVILFVSTRLTSLEQILEEPVTAIVAVIMCVLWCLCSHQIRKLDRQSSATFLEEFRYTMMLQQILPALAVVIVAVKVLFFL